MGAASRVANAARVLAGRPPTDPDVARWLGGGEQSHAGIEVTAETAISGTAILCAIMRISELTAMLPGALFEWDGDNRLPARGRPEFRLVHDAFNDETTAMEGRCKLLGSALIHGNSYAFIVRNRAGLAMELIPIRSRNVSVWRNMDVPATPLVYTVTQNGVPKNYSMLEVLHIPGFCTEGVLGLNRIHVARESIGLTLAQEIYAATFFGNGAKPGGILSVPNSLGDTPQAAEAAAARILKVWNAGHQGVANSHKTSITENGTKYESIGLSPGEAQLIEGRVYQLGEAARLFCIPPHLLADLSNAHFTNMEQSGQEFVTYTLQPWLTRIEQRFNLQLLSRADQNKFFFKHNVNALMRGDSAARVNYYRGLFNMGSITSNQIMALEEMNTIGPEGDQRLVQLNMTPLDQLAEAMAAKNGTGGAGNGTA